MNLKHKVRKLFWKAGLDISKFDPKSNSLARRKRLLEFYEIDTVLDVGANTGQFAIELRSDLQYSNRIISFEPLSSVFPRLKSASEIDPFWDAHNFAIGDVSETRDINISGNSYSSSMLAMFPLHSEVAPESRYLGRETVTVKTIDSFFTDICGESTNIYMKIDVQGFEKRVLKGAENSLSKIATIQLEMSLAPLYEDELLFNEMCLFMKGKGYSLVAIENGFSDSESGRLLQVDGIFHRF